MTKIDSARGRKLIEDIIAARHDMMELAGQHGLSPEDLATWINEPGNARVLGGLCLLADLQTQILLSRYRLLAASRLIKLATSEGADPGDAEAARRACVDLLKLELKRAEVEPGTGADDADDVASLRSQLLGPEAAEASPTAE